MGTSGAYSGSGGAIGTGIRDGVSDWIDSLPPHDQAPGAPPGSTPSDEDSPTQPKLDPITVLPVVELFRPRTTFGGGGGADGPGGTGGARGGDRPGGGRRGGGPRRSAAASARSAGRAAAAAYAYRTGDTATLDRLGLNYAELAELGDPFEISRRIVEAACGPRANSTIEDHERRLVAADVAEWVLTHDLDGQVPSPAEIVRHTIALLIAEALFSETGEILNNSNHAALTEQEIRDAAEALVTREQLSDDGVSEAEFSSAIERGIETLRGIVQGVD